MKKYLVLILFILTLCCVKSAMAADDPLKVSMELSQNRFSEPAEILVAITVTNVDEKDMPGPATLYDPSDRQIEEFGSPTLTAGMSVKWTGTWTVTQEELEAGKLAFRLRYTIYNDEAMAESKDAAEPILINKTKVFSKKIIYRPDNAGSSAGEDDLTAIIATPSPTREPLMPLQDEYEGATAATQLLDPNALSDYGYVTSFSVNFRSEPDKNSERIGRLHEYAFCFVFGTEISHGDTWYHVSFNGIEGYIIGDFFTQMTYQELEEFFQSKIYQEGIINNSPEANLMPHSGS